MRGKLCDLMHATDQYALLRRVEHNDEATSMYQEALELIYPVNAIIDALNRPPTNAGLQRIDPDDEWENVYQWGGYARRALGAVDNMSEVAERLRPAAPVNAADELHGWVWKAASPFWGTGHHATAVETAAKSLTAHVQQKAGSNLADRELVTEVFAPKPGKPGTLRLWLPGDRDTDTWRSQQDGLHLTAMGAFAGIRNVAAHTVNTGWSEQQSLEYLSVLSTVARWADATETVPQ